MGPVADERLPSTEVFLDDRGSLLRVRWDEVTHEVTVSIWRGGVCVATHRLQGADTARLSSLLTQAWVDDLRSSVADA